jgi:hypothetical protein
MTMFPNRAVLMLVAALAGAAARADNPDDHLRLNQIQVVGTHNSYHAGIAPSDSQLWLHNKPEIYQTLDYRHASLTRQLESGVRQIELDVFSDEKGGLFAHPLGPKMVADSGLPPDPDFDPDHVMEKPGFKVMHIQDFDYRSVCQPFTACLAEVKSWSDAHPNHLPIFILIENKDEPLTLGLPTATPEPFTTARFDALDAEIASVIPRGKMITPDDVRGTAKSLSAAVRHHHWPTLAEARGKLVFLMDQKHVTKLYLEGHPALKGRLLFTNAEPGAPDAAFVEVNDNHPDQIAALVRQGYLVRTRTDEGTIEARKNDISRRDALMASGAQILSTDYPASEPATSGYQVAFPGQRSVRCNVLLAPKSCRDDRLE